MRRLLEVLGFVAVLQGVAGLVTEFTGRHWGLVRQAGFLDGHGLYASVALLVLGVALFAVAEAGKRGE
ncbi:hypothetical protein [Streptomyces sp. NPDC096105]|uniref:hypothetical protein n=1 Tax=Streptomyces sp. NPDC096105 TaxID=3366074 RepID=UPI00382C74F7